MIETEKVTAMKVKHQSKSSTGLSWFERIGYGFGDMSYNIIFQFVNAYLLFYYTDVGGIQPAVIATLFLVVRVLDAIFDPIMGLILDKTNTRWGKARPYLLWVAFPFALFTFLCFTTPHFGETGNMVYAYVTYILLGMSFSMQTIPVNSFYVLLPVWMVSYDYERAEHIFAMNGQTGKVVGKPPISSGKVAAWFSGIAGGTFLALKLVSLMMGGGF